MRLSYGIPGLSRIPIEIPVGHTLRDFDHLGAALDIAELAAASEFDRAKFFSSDAVDNDLSGFGHLFSDPAFLHFRTNPIRATKLSELVLLGSDGVVLRHWTAVFDTLFDVSPWQPSSIVDSFERGKSLRLKSEMPITRRLPEGVYLVGFNGCWQNYAHWMQQTLPWLVGFLSLRERVPDLRLLMPPFARGSFHHQTLQLLGIKDDDVVVIGDGELVAVPSAYLINRIDLWSVPAYCRIAANELKQRIPRYADSSAKVYIHRRAVARQLSNFSAIQPLLALHGFTVVEFEDMPLDRQIAQMRNARYVIGEHGAGLINIAFCEPNAQVLELFNPACVQPAFWSIASACGLGYGFLVGAHSPTEARPKPDWNSAYAVPYEKLDHAIRAMLQGTNDGY